MARRGFQKGQLFKCGRRRKVWVGRWREDVLLKDGAIGQVRRWQVLGTVADFPSRREAQVLFDERLRPVNGGASRPEASIAFGTFVEEQWKAKVPVKIAQEQLGHASISTTLNIYTHVVDASHRAAIERVERQLFPTVPKSQEADSASESENADENASPEAPAAARERRRAVAKGPTRSVGPQRPRARSERGETQGAPRERRGQKRRRPQASAGGQS